MFYHGSENYKNIGLHKEKVKTQKEDEQLLTKTQKSALLIKGMKEMSVELMVESCCVVMAMVCFMKKDMRREEMQTQRVEREREREREDNFLVIKMGMPIGEEREEENACLESSTHVGG